MTHPALSSDSVALITGGAAGIGLACATRLARLGLRLVIVDRDAAKLADAAMALTAEGAAEVMTSETDISDPAALRALKAAVDLRFGGTDILMNNAGIQPGSDIFDRAGNWQQVIATNLMGVVNGCQIFVPDMVTRGRPGLVINTGSKQGITTPPGDPAYNVAKSGVKTFTEALEHDLRNTEGHALTTHLLIPGFVFTELNRGDRTEKPEGAWTPAQCADFMMDSLGRGDFYILCPDNDVPRPLDEKRIAWAAGDIIENRPPLSRWHPDYGDAFAAYLKD